MISILRNYFKKHPYRLTAFGAICIVVLLGICMELFLDLPRQFVDETTHTLQIKRLYRGDARPVGELTNIPGYHYATTALLKAADLFTPLTIEKAKTVHIRMAALLWSVLWIIIVFLIARRRELRVEHALATALFPILFLFLFLSYTEVLATAVLSYSLLLMLRKNYTLSAAIFLLGLLVRQDHIIWLPFFILYALLYQEERTVKHLLTPQHWYVYLKKFYGYIGVGMLFVAFFLYNGGVAVGDATSHPLGFYGGNIFMALILAGVLFVPLTLLYSRALGAYIRVHPTATLTSGAILAILYNRYFVVDHEYNLYTGFIHNETAMYFAPGGGGALFGYILLATGVMTLSHIAAQHKELLLLYFFSLLALGLHWLIEFRYTIVPSIFLLLLMPPLSKSAARYLLFYFWAINSLLFYLIFIKQDLFL